MGSRLLGVTSVVLLMLLGLFSVPAVAAEADEDADPTEALEEEHAPLPSIEEIGSQNEVSQQFRPEAPEPPVFADALLYPLLALGVVVTVVALVLYLVWQPRFGREREEGRKR